MEILYTNANIFELPDNQSEAVCVTTNGIIKSDGRAVMGAGIAREANERFNLDLTLAKFLKETGNNVYDLGIHQNSDSFMHIISFPTKNHWRYKSDLGLIERSAYQLAKLADRMGLTKVYLPPVGCGNGGRNWDTEVSQLLHSLDERFVVVFKVTADDAAII